MKTFRIDSITCSPPADRYGPRSFTLSLSSEILTIDNIVTITAIVQTACFKNNFEMSMGTAAHELPESDEEIAIAAEEKRIKDLETKIKSKKTLIENMTKVITVALKGNDEWVVNLENALESEISGSWVRNPVRDALKEEGLYYDEDAAETFLEPISREEQAEFTAEQ